jgi:hypothetical protein
MFNVTVAPSMISVGDTSTVRVAGDAATLRALKWSSNNSQLASVSSRGVVRALRPGRVSISASLAEQRETVSIEIREKVVAEALPSARRETPAPDPTLTSTPTPTPTRAESSTPPKDEAARATPPKSEPPAPDPTALAAAEKAADEAAVRKLVSDYASALSAQNLSEASLRFPGMPDNVRKGYQDMFKAGTRLREQYDIVSMDLKSNAGTVRVKGMTELSFTNKMQCKMQMSDVLAVEQSGGAWHISSQTRKLVGKSGC